MDPIIRVEHLSKRYKGATAPAVDDISSTSRRADPTAATAQARTAAMADARQRAQALAQAAGVTLGAPISISEVSALSPTPYPLAAPVAGINVPTPVQAGITQVEVDVQVTFAIAS